jgi:6-phosphofructokinase 1
MSAAAGNLLVLQGGGPTAVINASLFGVIDEALKSQRFAGVLGARFGVDGLIKADFIDLTHLSEAQLSALRRTPGASLASSRRRIEQNDLDTIVSVLKSNDIRALVIIGGNGTLHGAGLISSAVDRAKLACNVIGVPKTIDNDIPHTDRCPGFGSAARYVAQSVRDLGMDVRTLPQPVSIFETMGRNAGWLAGASVLAKLDENHSPHLVCIPERPFDLDRFIGDVDHVVKRIGWAVAVVSDGLKDAHGKPVYETSVTSQRDALGRALAGGVASHLADVVAQKLNVRCRWEKPGLCARASALHVSSQDRDDAELVGREAVGAAVRDQHAQFVSLRPLKDAKDSCELVPLTKLAGGERLIPAEMLTDSDLTVSPLFEKYVRRIVGELVEYPIPLGAR